MTSPSYAARRGQLETYFDRTAVEAWSRLTSDAPVSRVRATVRAGRDAMRETLLSWLPADLSGRRVLDAGCGTGALSLEAARRGATVVAVDVSPTLIGLARERTGAIAGGGSIDFRVGDMLDPDLGSFDHVVAMDSLIHYSGHDIARALAELGGRTRGAMVFTVAPRTALLTLMHAAGKLFPQADRAPAIVPITTRGLARRIAREPDLAGFALARTHRVNSGFYLSNAVELRRCGSSADPRRAPSPVPARVGAAGPEGGAR
ncbi:magnesium protoporphyrin IX methyltransferase [Methylobacterium nigriterrae]|uniref:magnesium protoporphyrin IX methyltransferase n=1 Tax=Methylobacterium nigriterrae TaxID=3127512 RepID=UPI0030133CF4